MLDRVNSVVSRVRPCPAFIVYRNRFFNGAFYPTFTHIFLLLSVQIPIASQLSRHCTRSACRLSSPLKGFVKLFGRVHCNYCRESVISCPDVLNGSSLLEYSLPLFPSVFLALASMVLAERKNVESGVNHVLSCGGQGN